MPQLPIVAKPLFVIKRIPKEDKQQYLDQEEERRAAEAQLRRDFAQYEEDRLDDEEEGEGEEMDYDEEENGECEMEELEKESHNNQARELTSS
jgi:hypothetical protein